MSTAIQTAPASRANWIGLRRLPTLRLLETGALALYSAIIVTAVWHHEPWFDEAHSWLLARDTGIAKLFWERLRVEGTPGLWHIILFVANACHLPYAALQWISVAIAIGGTFVLLKFAPFPRPIKLALPFCFFLLFQYAVVARSYVLLPLLVWLTAHYYRRAITNPYRFTLVLVLLSNVALHGICIALGFAAGHCFSLLRKWRCMASPERRRQIIAISVFLLNLIFLVAILLPPLHTRGWQQHTVWSLNERVSRTLAAVDAPLFGFPPLSAIVLLTVAVWCWRNKGLIPLLIPVITLAGLFGFVYGSAHHEGILFVALVGAVWASWPAAEEGRVAWSRGIGHLFEGLRGKPTWRDGVILAIDLPIVAFGLWFAGRVEFITYKTAALVMLGSILCICWPGPRPSMPLFSKALRRLLLIEALLIMCLHVEWSYTTLRNDWSGSYSATRAAAVYLKSINAQHQSIAFADFNSQAILAYFGPDEFHSTKPYSNSVSSMLATNSDWLVLSSYLYSNLSLENYAREIESHGYSLCFTSRGQTFYKQAAYVTDTALIFHRATAGCPRNR